MGFYTDTIITNKYVVKLKKITKIPTPKSITTKTKELTKYKKNYTEVVRHKTKSDSSMESGQYLFLSVKKFSAKARLPDDTFNGKTNVK